MRDPPHSVIVSMIGRRVKHSLSPLCLVRGVSGGYPHPMYAACPVRHLFALACALFALCARGAEVPPGPAPAPRLHCDEPVRDFGVVTNATEVAHTFVLRNTGNAPLDISRVHTPCGCTTANLKTKTISPGSSVDLEARLSLAGRNGRQRKNIYVHCNDPAGSSYKLELRCEVTRDITCEPSRLFVGDAVAGTNPVSVVRVRSGTGISFSVTAATVSSTNRLRTAIVSPGAGTEHVVQLFLKPGHSKDETRINDRIVIRTDHPRMQELKVPVKLYFKPRFAVSPKTMVVPKADGMAFTRYILVHSPRNEAFSLLRLELPSDKIEVEDQKLSASRHRIVIRNLGHDPALDGKEFVLHLRAVDGNVTQLRVPIDMK